MEEGGNKSRNMDNPEGRKDKETDSPFRDSRKKQPANTFTLAQ